MSDAGEMTHDEMTHDYAATEMVAAVDSDHHDAYGDAAVEMICNGDVVAAVLFDSSNNIASNCMDNTPHHDLVLYPEARCMNSIPSTPIKQSKSFSYLLLFIMY
jgi:hypothetical protein